MRSYESPYVVVGGTDDHVHILFDQGKLRAPVEFVAHVKKESSRWINSLGDEFKNLHWQRGYGMFSVSPTLRERPEAYVRNQDDHHREETFQEEFREFLVRYGIEYDERFVWD